MLDTLPAKMEANIMRGALRAGCNVIKEAAKANVPVAMPGSTKFGATMGALRASIRVSAKIDSRNGVVMGTVKAGDKRGVFYAGWVEFGTKPHYISVPMSERGTYTTRRGRVKTYSMTTINKNVLMIGGNFVGPTVHHPGASPHPYMRPAMDSQAQNAVMAAGEYIKKRLATKNGLDTAEISIEAEA